MLSSDLINGLFETGGACAVGLSVRRLCADKRYAGLAPLQIAFFQGWGLWNLYYYPSLNQPFSFVGGAALAAMNAAYLFLLWRFQKCGS